MSTFPSTSFQQWLFLPSIVRRSHPLRECIPGSIEIGMIRTGRCVARIIDTFPALLGGYGYPRAWFISETQWLVYGSIFISSSMDCNKTPLSATNKQPNCLIRVAILTRSVFSAFFSVFPKFRYFPTGKNQEIPKFRDNTETPPQKIALVKIDPYSIVRIVPTGLLHCPGWGSQSDFGYLVDTYNLSWNDVPYSYILVHHNNKAEQGYAHENKAENTSHQREKRPSPRPGKSAQARLLPIIAVRCAL